MVRLRINHRSTITRRTLHHKAMGRRHPVHLRCPPTRHRTSRCL